MVDQTLFASRKETEGRVISMAGRGWTVQRIDWKERKVYVSPSESSGKTTWTGPSRGLPMRLARQIRHVLTSDEGSPIWSKRATELLKQLRSEYAFLHRDGSTVVRNEEGCYEWYSFAGAAVNRTLATMLCDVGAASAQSGDFALEIGRASCRERVLEVV